MTVVGLVVAALATLVPGIATYALVPWDRVAEWGEGEPTPRTVRGTRLGTSAAFAGAGAFVVGGFALLVGGPSTGVALAMFVLGTLLVVVGIGVSTALLVAEAL